MIKKDLDRLDRLLADGWREPGNLLPGDAWTAGVMSEIRRAAVSEAVPSNGTGRLALRISLAATAAAIALVAWTLTAGLSVYQELAVKIMDDPASLLFSSPFV